MIVVASMFAVINGFIVATILTSARGRHGHKERMDLVLVCLLSLCLVLQQPSLRLRVCVACAE